MSSIRHYYILLGSNVGHSSLQIYEAIRLLELYVGHVKQLSSIYRTEPWGERDQNHFLNQAIILSTGMTPEKVMLQCQQIEVSLGKNKVTKYGPRTIDIDLLMVDDLVIDEPSLTIPHPKMHERNFVLIPLSEIAAEVIHPILGKSIRQLKEECTDTGEVELLKL